MNSAAIVRIALGSLVLLNCGLRASASPALTIASAAADADVEWAKLVTLSGDPEGPLQSRSSVSDKTASERKLLDSLKESEARKREYREKGIRFFMSFPHDARRWEWLVNTLSRPPSYWADLEAGAQVAVRGNRRLAQIDEVAVASWNEMFLNSIRPAFFRSAEVTSEQRASLHHSLLNQLQEEMLRSRKTATWEDIACFVYELTAYAAEPAAQSPDNSSLQWAVIWLKQLVLAARMDLREQRLVSALLGASANEELRGYAAGMNRIIDLYEQPLELQLTSMGGKSIDVADYRGRVLLLDFWSTSCLSCLEAMPKIKQLYERYHNRGFEVIGVCLEDSTRRPQVEKILARVDTPWLGAWVELAKPWSKTPLVQRFSITGVPVLLLLDQKGRLVGTEFSGESGLAKLEDELQRLLPPTLGRADKTSDTGSQHTLLPKTR